jgi:hypothetical protein
MKPVFQTVFGKEQGNCFAACLASILEMVVSVVPNFPLLHGDMEWIYRCNQWLWPKGLGLLAVAPPPEHIDSFLTMMAESGAYFIVSGESGLGCEHAVIYKDGKLVHDPMPGGDGIKEVRCYFVLFALNPASVAIGTDFGWQTQG